MKLPALQILSEYINNTSDRLQNLFTFAQGIVEGKGGKILIDQYKSLIETVTSTETMQVFDIVKHEWNIPSVIELPESERTLSGLFKSESANARFVQDVMATTLCYTADLVPDIADDIVNVDRAMRWGFAWQCGPFELIDKLGAQTLINLVNKHHLSMPKMLQVLIDSGESTFYRNQGTEYLTTSGIWEIVPD